MSLAISGTAITFPDASTQTTSPFPGGFAFRNRIINGAMMIDQRNAGASFNVTTSGGYGLDRWLLQTTGANGVAQQSSWPSGNGFANGINIQGASSLTGFFLSQRIEAKNSYDLAGNSITISVTAYSAAITTLNWSLSYATATDNFTSVTSISSGSWTINSSSGRYTATVSVPSGATTGLQLSISTGAMAAGQSVFITGVQLEKGSTATSFDYRPYGTELALCQRYLPCFNGTGSISTVGPTVCPGTTAVRGFYYFKTTPRVPPTGIVVNSVSYFTSALGSTGFAPSAMSFEFASNEAASIACTVSGATVGQAGQLFSTASGQIQFTGCEL